MEQSLFDRLTNSRFYALGEKLGDIMLLSLCWIIGSLPIFTLGASTTALYYAVHQRTEKNSTTPVQDFIRSYRQNFFQATILTVIVLLYAGATFFNLFVALFGYNGLFLPSWYAPIAVILILPFLFCVTFLFPYLARFKNSIRKTLFHSFTFSSMYLSHTLLMWLFIIASIALAILFFPSLLIVPFACCYLCHRLIEKDFNYAIFLRNKREHPELYPDENASSEEDDDDEDEYEDDDEDDDEEEDEEYEDDDDDVDEDEE